MNIITILWLSLFYAATTLCDDSLLQAGSEFRLGDTRVRITRVESLPYVQSDYTRRFKFDSVNNAKLKQLRTEYRLEEVIASGRDEFEKQILLMDWVHNQFRKFGQPSISTKGALDILHGIEQGHTFFCSQYAQLFASSAASLGWVDRVLALRRHQGVAQGGSSEHSTTEIWSNQYRKWVMLDPTSNLYLEKGGTPLNAFEVRQEWFYNGGKELVFVVGKDRKKYRKSDLPIFLKKFADFGDLTFEPDELDKYGFIGYIPNTDLMDSGFDYGQMFIVKDRLCEGTPWHKRVNPENPAVDPYFPIGQTALNLRAGDGKVIVELRTFTPNFKEFQVKMDEGEWQKRGDEFDWSIKPGVNRLQARALNAFNVSGPVSSVETQSAQP